MSYEEKAVILQPFSQRALSRIYYEPMKIVLKRYYGDRRVTKSRMELWHDNKVVMCCEAREPRFDRYTEAFAGCSQSCLAEGVWLCKPMPSLWSPMTPTIVKSPGHRSCRFAASSGGNHVEVNIVMVGRSDGCENVAERGLTDGKAVFEELVRWMYRAFERGEPVTVEVKSEK